MEKLNWQDSSLSIFLPTKLISIVLLMGGEYAALGRWSSGKVAFCIENVEWNLILERRRTKLHSKLHFPVKMGFWSFCVCFVASKLQRLLKMLSLQIFLLFCMCALERLPVGVGGKKSIGVWVKSVGGELQRCWVPGESKSHGHLW